MELRKKRVHFLERLFCPKEIFSNICVLFQCIVYWKNFHTIYTFTYQKIILHTLQYIVYQCIVKVNKSGYIALFVVSGSIKKLLSSDCVNIYFSQWIVFANIYLFSISFSIDFKSVGSPHIAYIVIHQL